MKNDKKILYQNTVRSISEESLSNAKLLRTNKRGKTCVIKLDNKVEVVLKFPTSEELVQFVELFVDRKYA